MGEGVGANARDKNTSARFCTKMQGGVLFVGHYGIPANTMTFVLVCMCSTCSNANGNKWQTATNMIFLYLGTIYGDRNRTSDFIACSDIACVTCGTIRILT